MIVEASYIPVIEDYNKDGTLKLSAILKILENAGNCHSDSVGDNVLTGSNNGKAWVLTDWKLEIISYPVYGNDIKTQTCIFKEACYCRRTLTFKHPTYNRRVTV